MDLNALLSSLGPIQESMKKADAERATARFAGRAGGGAVTITLDGQLGVAGVTIAPAAASAAQGDVGMLEDLVSAALADALRQYRDKYGASAEEQMQKMMAGKDPMSLLGPLMGGLGGR